MGLVIHNRNADCMLGLRRGPEFALCQLLARAKTGYDCNDLMSLSTIYRLGKDHRDRRGERLPEPVVPGACCGETAACGNAV
jgi:hypothetical protein